jgi:hypothetical protein
MGGVWLERFFACGARGVYRFRHVDLSAFVATLPHRTSRVNAERHLCPSKNALWLPHPISTKAIRGSSHIGGESSALTLFAAERIASVTQMSI